ncbi:MAG: hypothetical protein RR942_13840 [Romboutsia sp.]
MTIQKLISEISRKIGELEIIHYGRDINSTIKANDLLAGAYMLDDFIELRGATGMEVSLEQDRYLEYEKMDENSYRFYNRNLNILIRPLEY